MLVYTDAILKFQLESEHSTLLKLGVGKYNQYKRYRESLLSIAIGNIHTVIITACEEDTLYAQETIDKDLVAFFKKFRAMCTNILNSGVAKHNEELEDISYLKRVLNYRQNKGQTDIDFADRMEKDTMMWSIHLEILH